MLTRNLHSEVASGTEQGRRGPRCRLPAPRRQNARGEGRGGTRVPGHAERDQGGGVAAFQKPPGPLVYARDGQADDGRRRRAGHGPVLWNQRYVMLVPPNSGARGRMS